MPVFQSRLNTASAVVRDNTEHTTALIAQLHTLQARAAQESAKARPRFAKRGQLLPRERLALLLDAGAPFLELASLAGYLVGESDPEKSVPGAGMIAGIGYVSGTRCMIVVADSGIDAGALQPMGLEKFQRLQKIALDNRLPFVHLVESAGANLMQYRVEEFVNGGGNFYQLAKLSAAGIPVLTLVHGSSTAGGAYMPGLSDYVVMVRDRAKAFLAGPPLLKAATGEIATDEELGGAMLHASVSGLAEYLADDDADGIRILRELVDKLGWNARESALPVGAEPTLDANELLGIMSRDGKKPADMREVIARIVDASDLLEFQPLYGPATVCAHARIHGIPVGIITNNGPLDPAGATKATHFIQSCCQSDIPIVYLQNTTGFIVGKDSERAGMIKHGSKMIQAVSNATVPQITILCGSAFGAGNFGMCGRGFNPSFLFSWPNARTAVMGAEQAALTMSIVMESAARAKGLEPDVERIEALRQKIVANFERQTHAFYTSGRMLDDGVIDPRDTRRVIAMTLSVCRDGRNKTVYPLTFGVARP
ncbi:MULTISPECIES: acyl-CoA carboxylase subunit beta [Paraburkholderia]|uniref:acyl-CoA carboxylase subunit beta n=1 Tax=Paraburkholderia TaxID=1822464 RepID=UPI0022532E3B|nr:MULTISPECIES: acyl-CoA carboxylase subunit beta [Paraburkholderia]MCX4160985.1 acyl-CoA carboxylase subunit beta [Paraburkholderia megapolitana]MDN7156481.1 acyl-CoA carboxylase subunit beta [Paraburkholderia sp. CHISQ3]MDQ6493526.1 acyl-CoA carboxylase subunit beta [Paraburkholderia megapolitana]